jgi:integrase/recombinase XerD
MTTTATSTAIVVVDPTFSDPERYALAGFLAGYRGLTRDAYALDLRQFTAEPTSNASAATSKPPAGPGPPWPGGCAPWPASTATPSRKNCSTTPRRSMSADPAWTTSPTPPDWTATRSAPCWSRPDSARGRACPHLVAGPQRVAGVRGHRCQHRGHGPGARPSDPDHLAQGRQDGHHPVGATHRPGRRPGRRGTLRRADLPGRRRQPPRPPRRRQDRAPGGPAGWDHQTSRPHTLRHAFITAALDAGVPLRDVQEAASHADPRTTMRYDRARVSLDRHATYIVAAFIAGAAR